MSTCGDRKRFLQLAACVVARANFWSGRKLMKPIGELNRSTVLVLYWVLFGGGGNSGVGKAGGGSRRHGLGHCRAAAKCAHAVRGSAQVVCRPAARGVVGEWAHTSSEPCREGGASALVTEAGKVMSYPSGGSDRAAEARCGSS